MTIDIKGPDGNVFAILGYASRIEKQLAKKGIRNQQIDHVLDNAFNMKYEDILDMLEESEMFDFIR